jgi:branched-chain amino acid transport system substrate-binding protein
MSITRRGLLASAAVAWPLAGLRAQTQTAGDSTLRLGMLTDLSGPYRDDDGPTSVVCAQQAIAEAVAADPSLSVSLVVADHQQKPDVGVGIVREWIDRQGVDVIVGVGNSPVAFACYTIVQDKDKIQLNTAAASSDLTGKNCSPNLIHWTFDTWELANSTARSVVGTGPARKKWFFIVADYAFGHILHEEAAKVVTAMGGTVTGAVVYPFPGVGFLVLSGAGAGQRRHRRRPRQWRGGRHQLRQAGEGIRPGPLRRQHGCAGLLPAGHHVGGPADRAGPAADRGVLLGPE